MNRPLIPPRLQADLDAMDGEEPDIIDLPEPSEAAWAIAQRGPGARERILTALGTVHLERNLLSWLM